MERGQQIRAIIDLVGIVGVVGSLVFVGLEVRQNTQAARAAAFEASVTRSFEANLRVAESRDLSNDLMRWAAAPETLDSLQLFRQSLVMTAFLRSHEMLLFQEEAGMVDPLVIRARAAQLTTFVATPGFSQMWQQLAPTFTTSFRARVDSILSEGG